MVLTAGGLGVSKVQTCLVAQTVKNLLIMQVTQVQSLGQEDPLEKGMATCSSILAWRIPQTQEPGELQSMGSQRVRHGRATDTLTFSKEKHRVPIQRPEDREISIQDGWTEEG